MVHGSGDTKLALYDPATVLVSEDPRLYRRHVASCSASAEGAAPAWLYEMEWPLLLTCVTICPCLHVRSDPGSPS